MKEDFLHYLWKFKKFNFLVAKTTEDEPLQIINVGSHNTQESGPDFFNAKVEIASQLWAGNVEVHLKASDWYAHRHEEDESYDNVILHVVWEDDVAVFRKDGSKIPTLQLKDFTASKTLDNYKKLLDTPQKWINCENDFHSFDEFKLKNWLERLYVERLESKSILIKELLINSENDWEAVLFQLLAKNFGLNKNGRAFLALAQSIPFSVIRKIDDVETMEALLMGQAHLLSKKDLDDPYFLKLQKEYDYLKHKYQLQPIQEPVAFFRLRPPNFPTIRLSQLANLYIQHQNLFSKIKELNNLSEIHQLFEIETSTYWKKHYSFGKESRNSTKKLSKKFVNLLIINSIIPLQFAYQKQFKKLDMENLFNLLQAIPAEENSTVKKFNQLRKNSATNAWESQALLELKPNYCDKNKCLTCNLGLSLLKD